MPDQTVKARELLENGSYTQAAEAFLKIGEYASAARAYVCAKDYKRAAECYELALKPLDAARLYMLIREWKKAADLYAKAGDTMRAELALQQLGQEQGAAVAPESPPGDPGEPWPQGDIWGLLKSGDKDGAAKLYVGPGHTSGWMLLEQTTGKESLVALSEMLFQARDYAVAAEGFRRLGDDQRSAQCLSLAGLNEEAADLYMRCGQRALAAQHLEKAHSWDQAASIYLMDNLFLEAARCHEKDDEPVKAAALYLKAKKPDLALPLLQAAAPSHKQFAQCRLLAGKILFQKGQRDLAVALLQPLLSVELKSDEGLETFYQLAVLLEQSGETDKARDLYQSIQKVRFDFKDVTARLEGLEKASPAAPPPAQPPEEPQADGGAVDLGPVRDCSIFHRMDLEDLRRLWMVGRRVDCRPGEVLLAAGQHSSGLYVVLRGGLTITPDPSNPGLAAGFLGPSDYVGLGSLLKGPPQPNALVAQAGTQLLLIPARELEPLVSAEPEFGLRLFRSIAEHLVLTLAAGGVKK